LLPLRLAGGACLLALAQAAKESGWGRSRYAPLRRLRAGLRTCDQAVTGSALARGLLAYSQRGEPYVEEILAMMGHNAELLEETAAL
jgi:uncharacterized FlgJ-related protein